MLVNKNVYPTEKLITVNEAAERWVHWCIYAQERGLNEPEFFLPLAKVVTEVIPFSYEKTEVTKTDSELQN